MSFYYTGMPVLQENKQFLLLKITLIKMILDKNVRHMKNIVKQGHCDIPKSAPFMQFKDVRQHVSQRKVEKKDLNARRKCNIKLFVRRLNLHYI